jgi:hypothetical protein
MSEANYGDSSPFPRPTYSHHLQLLQARVSVLPTMMWSCTAMPGGFATSTIARVISTSARDGVGRHWVVVDQNGSRAGSAHDAANGKRKAPAWPVPSLVDSDDRVAFTPRG